MNMGHYYSVPVYTGTFVKLTNQKAAGIKQHTIFSYSDSRAVKSDQHTQGYSIQPTWYTGFDNQSAVVVSPGSNPLA